MREEAYRHYFSKASRLCAQKEKCEQDIRTKLSQWELSSEEADKIIDELKSADFINHQRYAAAFALDKLRFNHWGRRKISYALRNKGIGEQSIQEALDSLPEEYYENVLREELDKKLQSIKDEKTTKKRNKLCNYLLQKGFESGKVFELVDNKLSGLNN